MYHQPSQVQEHAKMSLGCVFNDGICSHLTEEAKVKRLNERDLSLSMSIASSYVPGIDLNTVVFDKMGYVANSTNALLEVLDAGLRRLYLDVYWDSVYKKWHLCPFRPTFAENSSAATNNTRTTTTLQPLSTGSMATLTVNSAAIAANTAPDDIGAHASHIAHKASTSFRRKPTSEKITFNNESSTDPYKTNNLGIKCDYVFDLSLFVEKLSWYLDLSDTNIAASMLYLHLRPKVWGVPPPDAPPPSPYSFGQPSINGTFNSIVNRILTPAKEPRVGKNGKLKKTTSQPLASYFPADTSNSGGPGPVDEDNTAGISWPTLRTFLYSETNRLVISYTPLSLSIFPELGSLDDIAFASLPTIENPSSHSVNELAALNFTDTFVKNEKEWVNATLSGVSPVLNESSFGLYSKSMISLLNSYDNWAWSTGQPILYTMEERERTLKKVGIRQATELAACAVFTETGLAVANCYAHFPVLCKHEKNELDWVLSSDNHTYFSPECPKKYKFAVPKSPLESRYIRENIIRDSGPNWHAWVDFNSLFLPNCWVSGGSTAVCPYNVVENNRNGIGYIAVAGAVAAIVGLVTVLFEWDRRRSPLLRNYKKRDTSRANEFEGIPS